MKLKKKTPIWEKSKLTLEEASDYTGIGTDKLRSLTNNTNCSFIIWNGHHRIIDRKKLETFIQTVSFV